MLLPTLKDGSNDSSESDPGGSSSTSRNATPSMSGKKKLPSNVTTTVSIITLGVPYINVSYIYIYIYLFLFQLVFFPNKQNISICVYIAW